MRGATKKNHLPECAELFLLTRPLRGATQVDPDHRSRTQFLLTRPLRGATVLAVHIHITTSHFYSHAPCGARHVFTQPGRILFPISTHTPLAGRDKILNERLKKIRNFYSHAPCGARLAKWCNFLPFRRFLLTRPLRGATA